MAEEEVDIDLADPEVGKAANKIQSCFKARNARKKKEEVTPKVELPPAKKDDEVDGKEKAVIDIDLEDPEVNDAAKKMQACFKARKKTV
jgi:hypothetical protein